MAFLWSCPGKDTYRQEAEHFLSICYVLTYLMWSLKQLYEIDTACLLHLTH